MKKIRMHNKLNKVFVVVILFTFITVFSHTSYAQNEIVIGVHAYHGNHNKKHVWKSFSKYLSGKINSAKVIVKPLNHDEMEEAIKHHDLDFVLSDPLSYIKMKQENTQVRPVVSVTDYYKGKPVLSLAGSIISLKSRDDLSSLASLKGKKVGMSKEKHLASYLSQAYTLFKAGISLPDDLDIVILKEHDFLGAIKALHEQRIDAAFIKGGFIEKMANKGLLDISKLKVINQQTLPGFPFAISTRLYPSQVLVMLPHVEPEQAQKMAAILLSIDKTDPILKMLKIGSFTVPVNYSPVTDIARELRIKPFDQAPEFTVGDIWERYRSWLIASIVSMVIFILLLSSLLYSNRKLNAQRKRTQESVDALSESTERFDLAMRASNDGLWDWDIQTNDVYFSPRWKGMLGYEDSEIENDFASWEKITHKDDSSEIYRFIDECLTGKREGFEAGFRMQHKKGHWVYIVSRATVRRDDDGNAIRLVGTHLDETEKREKENIIKHDQEQQTVLREMLENVVILGGDLNETLEVCLEKLLNISMLAPLSTGEVFLTDDNGESLSMVTSCNTPNKIDTECAKIPMGQCDCGITAKIGLPQFNVDIKRNDGKGNDGKGCIKLPDFGHYSLPLISDKVVLGVLSVHLPIKFKFNDNIVQFFASVADILAVLVNQKKQEKSLREYHAQLEHEVDTRTKELSVAINVLKQSSELENLVSDVTRHLIGIQPSKFDKQLETTLAQVGAYLNADRTHVIEFDFVAETFSLTNQWCKEGVTSTISKIKNVLINSHAYTVEQLKNDNSIIVTDIDMLSHEQQDLVSLASIGEVKSFLLYPIFNAGELHAAIGFEAADVRSDWNKDYLYQLNTLADSLGQIIQSNETRMDLFEAKEEAERLARTKSEFLANMSHEIRTPLNAVLGIAKIGERDSANIQDKNNFQRILDSGQHLYGLVNDILDFSKFEAGKINIEHVHFNLGNVIDKAVSFVSVRIFAKNLNFQVNESLDLPEAVLGDPLRVTQILGNLLGNALKFTEKGHIILDVRTENETLIFRISDSGMGMSNEQLSRLFNPFEQADNSTTRRFGGSGLGLAICDRLVKEMNGEIRVTSKIDSGSSFEVRLPLENPSYKESINHTLCPNIRIALSNKNDANELKDKLSQLTEKLAELPPLKALEKSFSGCVFISEDCVDDANVVELIENEMSDDAKIILIVKPESNRHIPDKLRRKIGVIEQPVRCRHLVSLVLDPVDSRLSIHALRLQGIKVLAAEDNELNRVVLEDLLATEGATVEFAENGRIALELFKARGRAAYDLVLMDIQMPVMDGYEATKLIHEEMDSDIPIIGLTAHAFAEEKQRCFDIGMVDHVSKPIDVETIVTAILKVVSVPQMTFDSSVTSVVNDKAGNETDLVEINSSENEEEQIDWLSLNERFSYRKEFISKLLTVSLDSMKTNCEKLITAIESKNISDISFVSHAVKGTSGNIKAMPVYLLAKETEIYARENNEGVVDMAKKLVEELNKLSLEIDNKINQVPDE